MYEYGERTEYLLGNDGMAALSCAHVAVFGIGGVGGYVAEALARAGVGRLTLIDGDTVSGSNINRQIIALTSTVGMPKVEVMKRRIAEINPTCTVNACEMFYLPEVADSLPFDGFTYICDAVDTVSAKLEIVCRAKLLGIPVISAMGAGNKLHPEQFEIADLKKTECDPLARVMRRELRARGIEHLTVVYSKEPPIGTPAVTDAVSGKRTPGSISFVPSAMGLIIAGKIVRDICGIT